jgi:pantoate--beta-alanine ligase
LRKAMQVVSSVHDVKAQRRGLRSSVAFVPTMGALHAGHMALVDAAKARCDNITVSIFVNPKQFGTNEDLSHYPRPLSDDLALLESAGVDMVFTPSEADLYPSGFSTQVQVEGLSDVLCGAHRAGHFAGVTTVVGLLFALIRPDVALFGEKDFQQLAIIKRMNQDLQLIDEVIGVPTVRESDGLALSSRNRYLTVQERAIAPALHTALCEVKNRLLHGEATDAVLQGAKEWLLHSGVSRIDYLEIRDSNTLALTDTPQNARAFIAARLGN